MKTKTPSIQALGGALLAGGLLSACGGGNSHHEYPPAPPPAPAAVPDSALVSSVAYAQFALTTSMGSSESDEPLNADKVSTPPSSDTDEPLPVS